MLNHHFGFFLFQSPSNHFVAYFRCGPCKMIAPLFNQLPSKYPKAIFLKVDVVRVHLPAKMQITLIQRLSSQYAMYNRSVLGLLAVQLSRIVILILMSSLL